MKFVISLIVFLLAVSRGIAANGDITGMAIDESGHRLEVYISGMGSNSATFAYGFATVTNKISGNEYVVITHSAPGYNDDGTTNLTSGIKVYGTSKVRLPYPSNSLPHVTINGSDCIVRTHISEWIYSADSSITATVSNGWYTAGGISNNTAAAISVTNRSTMTYLRPVADWSMVPWQMTTSNTHPVSAVAFHSSADHGRPVRAIKFWSQSTNSVFSPTQTVTTVSKSTSDRIPVLEYKTTLDISTLPQGGWFTNFFEVFPWRGNTSYVSQGAVAWNNRMGGFVSAYAWVDPTNGNDGTAYAVTNGSPGGSIPFATLGAAAVACKATNNLYGHNSLAGSILYLTNGTFPHMGSGSGLTHTPVSWFQIRNLEGVSAGSIYLTNASANQSWNGNKERITGCTIVATANNFILGNDSAFHWFENCVLSNGTSTASDILNFPGETYWTGNRVIHLGNQGLKPQSGVAKSARLIRGNWFDGYKRGLHVVTVLGNAWSNRVYWEADMDAKASGASIPFPYTGNGWIFSFNAVFGGVTVGTILKDSAGTNMVGSAIVQNVMEYCTNNNSYTLLDIGSSGSVVGTNRGNIVWHNTFTGGKLNVDYNDTTNQFRQLQSWVNNYADDMNRKDDANVSPGSIFRTNNWSQMNGVGHSGNFYADVVNLGGQGFLNEFAGLQSYQAATAWSGTTNDAGFVLRLSALNASGGMSTGGGNYALTNTGSPLANLAMRWVLPYDFEGTARVTNGASGAFEYQQSAAPITNRRRIILRGIGL